MGLLMRRLAPEGKRRTILYDVSVGALFWCAPALSMPLNTPGWAVLAPGVTHTFTFSCADIPDAL
jgi:hypothetical protein